jgi:hypothetical protein
MYSFTLQLTYLTYILTLIPYLATPHEEETKNNPIPRTELEQLLGDAKLLLNVHDNQYDDSIRHTVVKETVLKAFPNRGVGSLPLGVKRNTDNKQFVTWTGTDTILGDSVTKFKERFTLSSETRVTKFIPDSRNPNKITGALVRDLKKNKDYLVTAKVRLIHSMGIKDLIERGSDFHCCLWCYWHPANTLQ